MTYDPLIPQPTDDLNKSQNDLLNNFTSANNVYGGDHYAFDSTSGFAGQHNQVRLPQIKSGADPTASGSTSTIYALTKGSFPRLVFVKGTGTGSNEPSPTPLTNIQSKTVPLSLLASTGILIGPDFTGLSNVVGTIYVYDTVVAKTLNVVTFMWNGSVFSIPNQTSLFGGTLNLTIVSGGTRLQLNNTSVSNLSNIFWTIELYRMQS